MRSNSRRKDMNRPMMMLAAGAALLTVALSCEQDITKAPKAVETAFDGRYPGATMVEWERQVGYYHAEFFFDGHEMEALFDKGGDWRWSKTEILLSEVPDVVFEAAKNQYDGKWNIDDIDYYQRSSGEREYYRVDYEKENSDSERTVYIRPNGSVFKPFEQ